LKEKRFRLTKKNTLIAALIMLVLVILLLFQLGYVRKDWRQDHVTEVRIRQDGSALELTWSKIRSGAYRIEVFKDGKKYMQDATGKSTYRLGDIEYLADYEAVIYGRNEDGEYVKGASATIFARTPQEIKTAMKKAKGFAGNKLYLAAKAPCPLTFKSENERIATVDEKGRIIMNAPGETKIRITAEESETELPGEKIIPVICFPDELTKPTLDIGKSGDNYTTLRLGRVNFAEKYTLFRLNPHTGENEVYKEIDAEDFGEKRKKLNLEIAKDQAVYTLQASAKVRKKTLKSEMSGEAAVTADLDNASVYSSITVIDELDSDDVETVARAAGGGGASVAQSMCCTEDGYVAALVNRGNSIGRLEKYSRDGEFIGVNEATGDIGHANGCTYNPNNGNIYVMKTYASRVVEDIRVFDGETLESKDSTSFYFSPSGIGYDKQTDQYYMTASSRIYITDGDMGNVRTITRKRATHSQDVCGYNGIIMSCIWTSGYGSYIDMYRAYDGAYLGSIYAPFGEIEGACVDDGYLVMLYNGGNIYRTRERYDFPG